MSECETCGRPDEGHWIGCAETSQEKRDERLSDLDQFLESRTASQCIFPGCTARQRSADKRVKYCDVHSDPKNRK